MISDVEEDPSRPPLPGCNVEYIRWRSRRVIESIIFRLSTLILIFIDLIIVIVDLAMGQDSHTDGLKVADFVLSIYFVVEVITRLLVLTPKIFFVHWYNTLDLAVVFSTFIISCVALGSRGATLEYFALFTVFRGVRIIRIVRIFSEKQNLETGARQLISQNKRR